MKPRLPFPAVLAAAVLLSVLPASAANAPWGANRYDTVGFAVSGDWRDSGDFGDAAGVGVRGIWQPFPYLAADVRFSYFERAKGDEGVWNGIRTRVVPIEAALAGVLPLGEHAALYAGAGAGWYSIQVRCPKRKVVAGYDEEGHASYERVGGVTKNTDEFGFFVFAGGRVEVTESVWLFGEVRNTFLSADCAMDGVHGRVEADADGLGVSAGLVFGL
ncbi:MAG: outer membrane beta-barrel protein [Kiritimatiellae bacterium]|nr:outer membrane beta-barrel protein [Kiritimatiellia bacterium]